MDFLEVREQAREVLQRKGRMTYRALKRQFALDDDYIEDLKAELALLINQMDNQPEDRHELYLQVREKLNELEPGLADKLDISVGEASSTDQAEVDGKPEADPDSDPDTDDDSIGIQVDLEDDDDERHDRAFNDDDDK